MKMIRVLTVFAAALLLTVSAHAYEVNKPYVGGKLGLMMPDVSGADDALNVGLVFGMPIQQVRGQNFGGTVSVEGETTFTVVDGDIDGGGEWDVFTLAGYGVFRTDGQIYFKGKGGLVYWDADFDLGPVSASDDDINLSIGIGGGYQLSSQSSIELEYTILDSDLDFLSLGFNINF